MKRRNLIASIGAVVTGGAAVGTGAFTSVEAERTATVAIADEDEALLALESTDDPNNAFVQTDTESRNRIRLDFNNVVDDANGPGTNSVYEFDRVFEVSNQGAQDLFLQTEFEDTEDLDAVGFYVEDAVDNTIDDDVAAGIGTGNSAAIGVTFDTDGIDVERGDNPRDIQEFDATITATDEEPDDVDKVVDEDGNVESGGGGGG